MNIKHNVILRKFAVSYQAPGGLEQHENIMAESAEQAKAKLRSKYVEKEILILEVNEIAE